MLKRIIIILTIVTQISTPACFSAMTDNIKYPQKYEIYNTKFKAERAIIYNALDLTDEQKDCAEEIFKKHEAERNKYFEDLTKEYLVLEMINTAKVSVCGAIAQRGKIYAIEKKLKKILNEEDYEFKKILTSEQKSKLSMIRHLERKDAKRPEKDYEKSNPRLTKFGPPEICPETASVK